MKKTYSKKELLNKIQEIKSQMFYRYYNPCNKIWETHDYKKIFGTNKTSVDDDIISKLLLNGRNVKGGHAATSIRGYYTYYIFYN